MVSLKKNKINQSLKMQKNRFIRKPKTPKLKFGDSAIISKNEGRIELIQITFIKRIVKTFIRKRKSEIDVIREKIWYFGRPNFYIQKKSKNSRMGKGKGLIERKVLRVRQNFVLFEFLGVPYLRLKRLTLKINKILNVRFHVFKKSQRYYSLWSKKQRYVYYHEKYLS